MNGNRDGKLIAISEAQTGYMISDICAIGYSTDLSKISRRPLFRQVLFSIVLSIFVVAVFSSQSLASGKIKYFSGNSHIGSLNRLRPGNHQSGKNIRHKILTKKINMRGKQAWGLSNSRSNRPSRHHGARVITVSKVLSGRHSNDKNRRGNRIRVVTYTNSGYSNQGQGSDISRLLVRYGFGLTAPRYEDILCEGGYDCIIQLGNSRSSPKIIVIGKKRAEAGKGDKSGPKIIYPPS